MDTHIQGPVIDGASLGAVPSLREFTFSLKSSFPIESICTIGYNNPYSKHLFLEAWPVIYTGFNAGSSNVITLTDQNGNILVNWPDPTSTGVQSYRNIVLTASTILNINYTQSGTAATTGSGSILIRVSGMGTGPELTH